MAASLNSSYGILSFPNLFQARSRAENSDPVYSAVLIISPEFQKSPAFKAMKNACLEVAKAEWGERLKLADVRMPFRDGAEKSGQWAGYNDGDIFISPWSKTKPGIVDSNRQEVLLPEQVWAGQKVRMNITPFAWTNSGKKGVSFGLNHVQIVSSDMPRIDGRGKASDVFDDGEVEEDADAPF